MKFLCIFNDSSLKQTYKKNIFLGEFDLSILKRSLVSQEGLGAFKKTKFN